MLTQCYSCLGGLSIGSLTRCVMRRRDEPCRRTDYLAWLMARRQQPGQNSAQPACRANSLCIKPRDLRRCLSHWPKVALPVVMVAIVLLPTHRPRRLHADHVLGLGSQCGLAWQLLRCPSRINTLRPNWPGRPCRRQWSRSGRRAGRALSQPPIPCCAQDVPMVRLLMAPRLVASTRSGAAWASASHHRRAAGRAAQRG